MTAKLAAMLGAALGLALLIGWLAVSRANLKTDLATSEANAVTLQASARQKAAVIENMQRAANATESALSTREVALKTITAQRESLRLKLAEVSRDDPKVRAWADDPIPDSVRGLLRDQAD